MASFIQWFSYNDKQSCMVLNDHSSFHLVKSSYTSVKMLLSQSNHGSNYLTIKIMIIVNWYALNSTYNDTIMKPI